MLNGKEYKQWDFEVCLSLLSGPLSSQAALASTLSKTKFIKRLLSFLKPSKNFFSDLPWSMSNMIYIKVGVQVFRVMLAHQEGREYQFFNELVDEIIVVVCAEIDRVNNGGGQQAAEEGGRRKTKLGLTKQHSNASSVRTARLPHSATDTKLCREYFTFLGIMSESKAGRAMLDRKPQLYQAFSQISKTPSLYYIARLVIYNLSYQHSKTRELFKHWLEEGKLPVRLMIISQLRLILRTLNHLDPKNNSGAQWAISRLIVQLNPDIKQPNDEECALCALSVLEEACQKQLYLDMLIALKPNFDLVGDAAHNLQISFLATPAGFDLLNSSNWIETQLKRWRPDGGGNQRYVEALENALNSALNAQSTSSSTTHTNHSSTSNNEGLPVTSPSSYYQIGQPGSQPWAKMVGLRQKEDEFYFKKLHQLPWIIKVQVINHKGRAMSLIIGADLQTCYANKLEGEGMRTHVVGTVLDMNGNPQSKRIDGNSTIKARISVGAIIPGGSDSAAFPTRGGGGVYAFGEDTRDTEKICNPDDRKGLTEKETIVMGDLIR